MMEAKSNEKLNAGPGSAQLASLGSVGGDFSVPAVAGVAGQAAGVLPLTSPSGDTSVNGPSVANYQNILKSVSGMFSPRDGDALHAIIAQAVAKLFRIVGDVQTATLLSNLEFKRAGLANKHKKLVEAQEKIEQAQKSKKRAGIFSKIKAAFSVVAAVAAIAVGASLVASGIGSPGGVAMMTMGISMVVGGLSSSVMAADSIAQMRTGEGFMSKEMSIVMTVITIAAAVISMGGMAYMSFGTAATVATTAEKVHKTSFLATGAFQTTGTAATGLATVGASSGDIGSSVMLQKAANFEAAAKRAQADVSEIRAYLEPSGDFARSQGKAMENANAAFNKMLAEFQHSMNERARTFGQAQFGA